MAERWGKIAAGLHRNPKIRLAGRNAREVYIYAICTNADGAYQGRMPRGFFGPNYLANELAMTPDEAAQGLDACLRSHGDGLGPLLSIDGNSVVIVGWTEDEWGNPKSTTRVQAFRERAKQDETLRNVSPVSDPLGNGETQRRGEESRGEEKKIAPPVFDFEAVYRHYPRKAGKQAGLKKAKQSIRTEADYQALLGAVQRMSELWRGHDVTYCPHWSTFVSQERWRDEQLPSPSATASQVATASQELAPGVERW